MSKRDNITLEDNYQNKRLILYYGDDSENDEFEYIDEKPVSNDGEKGFTYFEVIIKRLSDGAYFQFEKVTGSAGARHTDFEGRQVFPKEVKIVIYE